MKKTTAVAVVLYERGDNYFELVNGRLRLVKEYHCKTKVLKQPGIEYGDIEIPYYWKSPRSFEVVEDIRAITHNGTVKTGLRQDGIFTVEEDENWHAKRFPFPDVKVGSILEYKYRIVTPFVYNFEGWTFQTDIPKLYSEFNAKIPGNYIYNRNLSGNLGLSANEASVKERCLDLPGLSKDMSCEVLKYAMEDIPAFKAEEGFMLAASNYISQIEFELSELYYLDGSKEKFTKSWKDVDKEFKTDPDIGRQLKKNSYFEKLLPPEIAAEADQLKRAKMVYKYIGDHYVWNGNYGIYRDIEVKEAFEKGSGNVGEINISLINMLNAAGIDANLVLLSTRNNGLPKKTHPVISDFNYIVVKAVIAGKDYLLDATDSMVPFGILPYRCLNYYGRVMDFKESSYWIDIDAYDRNKRTVRAQFTIDPDTDKLTGMLDDINLGYEAINRRKKMSESSEEDYLAEFEASSSGEIYLTDYSILEGQNSEKKTSERFEFEVENDFSAANIFLDPFVLKFFPKNPFLLKERNYPIDFGYKRNYGYSVMLYIPSGYRVAALPQSKQLALPQNMGSLSFSCSEANDAVTLHFNIKINSPHFTADSYEALKSLFEQAVTIQNKSVIHLSKT